MTVDEAIQLAFQCFQKGDFQKAENICKRILQIQPNDVRVLYFLGLIYYQIESYDLSIDYFRTVINLDPNEAGTYINLGNALDKKELFDEAIACYQKALGIDPNLVDAYINLGVVFMKTGKFDDAVAYYQKALQYEPNNAEAYNNLGNALKEKDQLDEAISCYQKAIQIDSYMFNAYYNLGDALYSHKQINDAIQCYQKAIELNPNSAESYNNLGYILQEKGQLDEAIIYHHKALQINSTLAEAYNYLGAALQRKAQLEEAMACYQKALQINPTYAFAHEKKSSLLLLTGNFEQGWKEFEWRWKLKAYRRNFSQRLWDGGYTRNQTILIHSESGFGDTIQFIRYVPLIAEMGAKVIVECQKELCSLIKNIAGVHKVVGRGLQLPIFDLQCPLMRLPIVFDTTLNNMLANTPYLTADPILVKNWKDKIKLDNSKLNIGLAWAGRKFPYQEKSCTLDTFQLLTTLNGIGFYSLQKGEDSKQVKNIVEGREFFDYSEDIYDFSDTAALIENLDLVISVDTAVAHLAGALGKPVWTLLPCIPDWRWMLQREDSPWYPSMRLFRQPSIGDWESVLNRVASELQKIIDC
jgi:tetratricopeptide (TPR) repeat protein